MGIVGGEASAAFGTGAADQFPSRAPDADLPAPTASAAPTGLKAAPLALRAGAPVADVLLDPAGRMALMSPSPPAESVMSSSMLRGSPSCFAFLPALPKMPTWRAIPGEMKPTDPWLLLLLRDFDPLDPLRACRWVG